MENRERNKHNNRKRRIRVLRTVISTCLVVWGILGLIGLFTILEWVAGALTGRGERAYGNGVPAGENQWMKEGDAREGGDVPGQKEETQEDKAGRYVFSEEEKQTCRRLYAENPDLLVLVNKDMELDAAFDSELRTICKGRLQASGWMYDDLAAMLKAAGDAGYDYWIASAYRSRQRQQELIDEDVQSFMQSGMNYEEALAETLSETMPAGRSEHETGLALDILCLGNTRMDQTQEQEPGNRWLRDNCARYGFILRYPKEREDITGIRYEPWHFRYVGREAAEFIMARHITLEEFCEILRTKT